MPQRIGPADRLRRTVNDDRRIFVPTFPAEYILRPRPWRGGRREFVKASAVVKGQFGFAHIDDAEREQIGNVPTEYRRNVIGVVLGHIVPLNCHAASSP